jgi:Glucodextranase, domain B
VPSNPLRRALTLVCALSLFALAGPVGAAYASGEESHVTSPAGPAYVLAEGEPSTLAFLKIEGATNIGGEVALRCYYGPKAEENVLLAKAKVNGEKFKAEVEVEAEKLHFGPCVLRAVPAADKAAHPPSDAEAEANDPFHGPLIVGSGFFLNRFFLNPNSNPPYGYEFEAATAGAFFSIDAAGNCGLASSYLYAPETLVPSSGLFACNAFLGQHDLPGTGTPGRSALQVDGANAYTPNAVHRLEQEELKTATPLPGAPPATVSKTFAAGLLTVTEVDPIVKCAPSTAFPPATAGCTSLVSTGVQLERTWQTTNADQVAWMTDTWKSTDGAAHSLNALYGQQTENGAGEGGAYEFPGTNVFAPTTHGESVTLPAGVGRILYKANAKTPAAGDGENPQGAIAYDTPPSGPLTVYRSTSASNVNGFEMPYAGTIPAGGAYTLRMAFIQAYKLPEVEALASEVIAAYPPSSPPTVTIASPVSGGTVSTPNVAVSGTVSDARPITSFTVDGHAVAVGSGGAWSTSVPLSVGANTIKAVATDQAGFSTEATAAIAYAPVATASQVGTAKGTGGKVTLTIACKGVAGTRCEIEATLTTVERSRNGRPVAVSTRRRRRTRSTQITVGAAKLTIPAGQRLTIVISLNAAGHSLYARFGRLPVHLTAVLVGASGRQTIIAENLTVRPAARRHRRRRHHRR